MILDFVKLFSVTFMLHFICFIHHLKMSPLLCLLNRHLKIFIQKFDSFFSHGQWRKNLCQEDLLLASSSKENCDYCSSSFLPSGHSAFSIVNNSSFFLIWTNVWMIAKVRSIDQWNKIRISNPNTSKCKIHFLLYL